MTRFNLPRFRLTCLALALLGCSEPTYDREFDPGVASPTYTREHPRVVFDEAHHNRHTAKTGYRPLAELLASDGYRVERGRAPFSAESLRDADVLVVVGAMGNDDTGSAPAFTREEIHGVVEWVRSGGSLLLVVDHFPFGDAASGLASAFGVTPARGFTEDSLHHDLPSKDRSQLVFTRENGLLGDHPITRGRSGAERIGRVVTFTGTSLAGPPTGALLRLGDSAVDYAPAVSVQRAGGDTRVNVEYVNPHPTRGQAQAIALEVGAGRVVIMGEAAALTAQRGHDGSPIGMNRPGWDNRQLALNVMHWLSRAL